jgi:hypothetical protein
MAVLVWASALFAACGSSTAKPGGGITADHAAAFAEAVNLRAGDVAGWRAEGPETEGQEGPRRELADCLDATTSGRKPIVFSSPYLYDLKQGEVSSRVTVDTGARADAATHRFAALAGKSSCYARLYQQEGQRAGGRHITASIVGPAAPGKYGSVDLQVRTTGFYGKRRGVRVRVSFRWDIEIFNVGPARIELISLGHHHHLPTVVREQLFALLHSRADAHRLSN